MCVFESTPSNILIQIMKFLKQLYMNNRKLLVEKDASVEQLAAIDEAIHILDTAGLELIGTRPKDR